MATVGGAIDRAVAALDALAELAEPIDEESQYVLDLRAVWAARLRAAVAARSDADLGPEVDVALDRLETVVATITDPHRAIDWLSTLPQAVLLALGEAPS